jgi:hypothetical protein
MDLEPTTRLKTSFSLTSAELNDFEDDKRFYKGYILRNITTYQFTRKLFFRGITQYNSFGKSFSIYPLVSYKFNAFTMFCAGMTRDLYNFEQEDYKFETSGYQYFVKLQYLFSL